MAFAHRRFSIDCAIQNQQSKYKKFLLAYLIRDLVEKCRTVQNGPPFCVINTFLCFALILSALVVLILVVYFSTPLMRGTERCLSNPMFSL